MSCTSLTRTESSTGPLSSAWGDEPNYRVIEGAWRSGAPYGTIHRVAGDGTVHGLFAACMDFCKRRMSHLRIDTHENNAVMRHLIARHRPFSLRHHLCGGRHPRLASTGWQNKTPPGAARGPFL